MFSNKSVTLALTAVLLGVLTCSAEERVTAKTPKPYSVCAGSCSRSMRVVARYETASDAIRAAEDLRRGEQYEHIGVAEGGPVRPLDMHASFRPNAKPQSVSVYAVGCKSCIFRGTLTTIADADAVAKSIADNDGQPAIVFHYKAAGE